jgi:hypothetical protein
MNAIHQPEIVATQRGAGSAEVTVRAILTTDYLGTCEQHNRPVRADLGEDIGARHGALPRRRSKDPRQAPDHRAVQRHLRRVLLGRVP